MNRFSRRRTEDGTTASPPTKSHGRVLSRVLGGCASAAGLVAAVILASGLSELVGSHPARGLLEIVVALVLRLIVGGSVDAVSAVRQRRLRDEWQRRVTIALAVSHPENLHALIVAVDHIGEEPGLATTAFGG